MTNRRHRGILTLLTLLPGCASMRALYRTEVRTERLAHPPDAQQLLTEDHLTALPDPVRRYLRSRGWVGQPLPMNAEIEWRESAIRLGVDRPWMKLRTYQFNSVPEPMRAAYMRGRVLGVVPMEGRDIYQSGRGQMLIRLGRVFTVGDETGPEMDQSALVTILAEVLLAPGYVIQPYITWSSSDDRSAAATIRHGPVEASGVFHFNEAGDFVRFESEDRYQSTGEDARKVRWSVDVLGHQDQGGLRIVDGLRATWHEDQGDFEYFRGRIAAVRFNVHD
jgi:hypothetical protein